MKFNFKIGGTVTLADEETAAGVYVTAEFQGFTIKAKGQQMAYKLPSGKGIRVRVTYVDGAGNPATVDGDVAWEVADPDIASLEVDGANSAEAWIAAVGKVGQTQVSATADADLGEGIRELICTMDLEVISGEAVAGTIEPVGEPADAGPYARTVPRR